MTSQPASEFPLAGGCACRAVRYRMISAPIIVHACHCSYCQRETGSAFVLNAVIESERVVFDAAEPERVDTPSHSGKGQQIFRCSSCRVALYSHYMQAGDAFRFLRVGTLDQPGLVPPDVHIYTSTKLPWLTLPEGARAVPEFYNPGEVWSQESMARWQAGRAR